MTGFEPQTSGIGSDRPTNCATTTSPLPLFLRFVFSMLMEENVSKMKKWTGFKSRISGDNINRSTNMIGIKFDHSDFEKMS